MRLNSMLLFFSILLLTCCQSREIVTEKPISYPSPEPTSHSSPEPTSHSSPEPISYPSPEPFIFPSSESDTISVHGTLFVPNPFSIAPDTNDALFLVPIPEEESISTIPSFTIGEVPQAKVDETTGEYLFVNIQPGQYAIVVVTTDGLQIPAKYWENGNLAIITLADSDRDQVIELARITIP